MTVRAVKSNNNEQPQGGATVSEFEDQERGINDVQMMSEFK